MFSPNRLNTPYISCSPGTGGPSSPSSRIEAEKTGPDAPVMSVLSRSKIAAPGGFRAAVDDVCFARRTAMRAAYADGRKGWNAGAPGHLAPTGENGKGAALGGAAPLNLEPRGFGGTSGVHRRGAGGTPSVELCESMHVNA